ncbi:SLC13 family permease [Desulfothermobacter acidiphilus]|uniref:SLC13 family permease n=1 Tax=Desulfothermobacter acidiphilus TaxID=1938353 RepID=UPI003F8CCAC6
MQLTDLMTLVILLFVYGGIATRSLHKRRRPLWFFFLVGALAMVATGIVTPREACAAIDFRVLLLLWALSVIAAGLKLSGALRRLGCTLQHRTSGWKTLALFFVVFGVASAFILNDSLAIIGTPIAIYLARITGVENFPFLLALAFALTIGSELTPMGNPQNLLVALASGMPAPVFTFIRHLFWPTLINGLGALGMVLLAFRSSRKLPYRQTEEEFPYDFRLQNATFIALGITVIGFLLLDGLRLLGYQPPVKMVEVALVGAVALLGLNKRKGEILRELDWGVLLLFVGLFVVTRGLENCRLTHLITGWLPPPASGHGLLVVLFPVTLLSQIISNVPAVMLYLPIMKAANFSPLATSAWLALAAGSTVAGNLTLLGAASNLIIAEAAEAEGGRLAFWRFFKYGLPLTLFNTLVLYYFLSR